MKIQLEKKDPGFKELRWLSKALSQDKSDTRGYDTKIFKKGDTFYASNGARMHLFDDSDGRFQNKPDGFYAISTNTASKFVMYLDEDEALMKYPSGLGRLTAIRHEFPASAIEVGDGTRDTSGIFAQVIRIMGAPHFVQYSFLKDALSFGGPFHVIQEAADESEKPVCLKSGDLFALIMPVMV